MKRNLYQFFTLSICFIAFFFSYQSLKAADIVATESLDVIYLDEEMEDWAPVKNYEENFKNSLDIASGSPESDRYFVSNKAYWKTFWEDAKSIVTAPSRMDKKDWAITAAVIGGGIGLMALDDEIAEWVQDNRNDTTQKIFDTADAVANPYLYAPALFATYLFAKKTNNVRLRRTSLMAFEMLVVAQVVNVPLKALAGRSRPKHGDSSDFSGPTISLGPSSFVSGHAIAAFGVATIFSLEYGKEKPWVPYLSYGIATMVSLERIHNDQHWASDVFLGAAIGTAIAYLIYKNAERRSDWMILPDMGKDYAGLKFTKDIGRANYLPNYTE